MKKMYNCKSYEDIPDTDGVYQYEKEKSKYPAYHFRMSAYDMALFGMLYLRNGLWNGKQIIPGDWIKKSTTAHSVADPELGLGYGYLWYVLPEDPVIGKSYLHTGAGIHMLAIFPKLKLVLIHRVDTGKPYTFTQANLFELWDLVFAARN